MSGAVPSAFRGCKEKTEKYLSSLTWETKCVHGAEMITVTKSRASEASHGRLQGEGWGGEGVEFERMALGAGDKRKGVGRARGPRARWELPKMSAQTVPSLSLLCCLVRAWS